MKKYIYVAVALVIGLGVAFGMASKGDARVLNVNDIGADPAAFTGTITFTGIMAGISQNDSSIFGVMDVKELQCTSANCNKIYIPVKFQGKQPVIGDEIKLTGNFQKLDAGYLFAAEKVQVVKNHKIGG